MAHNVASAHGYDSDRQNTGLSHTTQGRDALIGVTIRRLIDWFANFKGVASDEIEPYLYTHVTTQALTHWLRVAAGLDSMILGEPQIFGQIKQAVVYAQKAQ